MVFAATGRHALTGTDLLQIFHQVRTHDPDLSALPDPLRTLVAAALSKDPSQRPPARAILAALTGDPRQGAGDPADLVNIGAEQAGVPTGWAPGDPALGKLAEDAYTALPPEEQNLVPEVFLRCVVLGEDGSWSTRPVPAVELLDRHDPVEGQALRRVVRAFAPLLTFTGESRKASPVRKKTSETPSRSFWPGRRCCGPGPGCGTGSKTNARGCPSTSASARPPVSGPTTAAAAGIC
jgi:hypothetical protein